MTSTGIDACRLLLRSGLGLIFLLSGAGKLLAGTEPTVSYFASLGIPWPEVSGPAIGVLELGGGILLIVGLLTRLVSVLYISEMAVAILVAQLPVALEANSVVDGFVSVRLELLIIVAAACLAILGGGRWSVDSLARRALTR